MSTNESGSILALTNSSNLLDDALSQNTQNSNLNLNNTIKLKCTPEQIETQTWRNEETGEFICFCSDEVSSINGEQAKAIFSFSILMLSFCVIMCPYVLRYVSQTFSKKKRSGQKRSSREDSSEEVGKGASNDTTMESSHDDEMPTWLFFGVVYDGS